MLGTPNAPSMTLLGVSAQATATIVSARPASSWVIPPSHCGKSWRTGTISGAPTSVSPWGHKLPFWVGYHHPFPTRMHTGAGRRPSGGPKRGILVLRRRQERSSMTWCERARPPVGLGALRAPQDVVTSGNAREHDQLDHRGLTRAEVRARDKVQRLRERDEPKPRRRDRRVPVPNAFEQLFAHLEGRLELDGQPADDVERLGAAQRDERSRVDDETLSHAWRR